MAETPFAIAIDGPAASGKGTVARAVAGLLGFVYVDTGAMYRAVALEAERLGLSWDDAEGVGQMASSLEIQFAWRDGALSVFIDSRDVTRAIRTERMGQGASRVATWPQVRSALLERQREMARSGRVVVDGRDIGTVVLPDAPLKVYLDASAQERARRRNAELAARGIDEPYEETLAAVRRRDAQDMGRDVAPLCQAADAVYLDSTELEPVEVAERIAALARARGA